MEVFAKAVTEELITGERKVCTTAFLTFVALNEQGKPTAVPEVYQETEQQKVLHKQAPTRAKQRNERKKQSKEMAATFGTDYPWSKGCNRD